MNDWIEERINQIYTRVKSETVSEYKTKYPDINFTQDDSENAKAVFPCIYMYFDIVERMSTLDGGTINGVYMTIRTKVSVTKSQGNNVAREVHSKVREELKHLGFIVSGSPIPTVSGDIKVINANYGRVIGCDDPLII